MTHQSPAREPLLDLYDEVAQRQLRDAGAEVAAAIAHAVGTPLNVISGRAELIRHDPSNALAQVARIEEQVKKLATGLRQLVDYLALPDPRLPHQSASGAVKPSAREAGARADARRAELGPAPGAVAGLTLVSPKSVLDDVVALTETLASANHVEVVADGSEFAAARVERWHALGTLEALVSQAIRQCSQQAERGPVATHATAAPNPADASHDAAASHPAGEPSATSERAMPARVRIGGGVANQGVVFELVVPGLALVEGWQLEHFQARPAADCSEFYRTLSICAAVVRGHGGKLSIERAPNATSLVVRFSCINEAA